MSEPKKQQTTSAAEMDGLHLEIQRLEIDILNANTRLCDMQERIARLRQERDEMGGGQSLFMLENGNE